MIFPKAYILPEKGQNEVLKEPKRRDACNKPVSTKGLFQTK